MTLKYKVKASGITNLSDARFFNAAGADWLGFNLDVLNESSISLKQAKEIIQWLYQPKVVLECGTHQDRSEIIHLANELQAEAVQVTSDHPVLEHDHFLYPVHVETTFQELSKMTLKRALRNVPEIEVLVVKWTGDMPSIEEMRKDWKYKGREIADLARKYTVLVDLPFRPEWILESLELLKASGIQITCLPEEKPGLSNVDIYDELLSVLEAEA